MSWASGKTRPRAVGFACPTCGAAIRIAPDSFGRRARCGECRTLVEVPFFPRTRRRTASKSTAAGWGWAWVLIALGASVIVGVGTFILIRRSVREADRRAYEALVSLAIDDEHRHDWTSALTRFDAAESLGRRTGAASRSELVNLGNRRDDLATRLDRERNDARIARSRSDLASAVDRLSGPIEEVPRALGYAESAYLAAIGLDDPRAETLATEAVAIVEGLARTRGALIEPPSGIFLYESNGGEALAARLRPIELDGLRTRGYLPPSEVPALGRLWEPSAPYRLAIRVEESRGPGYIQAEDANRIARIRATLELQGPPTFAGGPRSSLWTTRIAAETGPPPGGTSAYLSTYLSQGASRDDKAEQTLYEFAVVQFLSRVSQRFVTLPRWEFIGASGDSAILVTPSAKSPRLGGE